MVGSSQARQSTAMTAKRIEYVKMCLIMIVSYELRTNAIIHARVRCLK